MTKNPPVTISIIALLIVVNMLLWGIVGAGLAVSIILGAL